MGAGQETSISVNEMAQLQGQIEQEIQEVKAVLKKVKKCCDKDPAEDDTILNAIDQVGQEMNASWDQLTSTLESVGNEMNTLLKQIANTVTNKTQEVKNMKTGL